MRATLDCEPARAVGMFVSNSLRALRTKKGHIPQRTALAGSLKDLAHDNRAVLVGVRKDLAGRRVQRLAHDDSCPYYPRRRATASSATGKE